jgi:hypothetical protein
MHYAGKTSIAALDPTIYFCPDIHPSKPPMSRSVSPPPRDGKNQFSTPCLRSARISSSLLISTLSVVRLSSSKPQRPPTGPSSSRPQWCAIASSPSVRSSATTPSTSATLLWSHPILLFGPPLSHKHLLMPRRSSPKNLSAPKTRVAAILLLLTSTSRWWSNSARTTSRTLRARRRWWRRTATGLI